MFEHKDWRSTPSRWRVAAVALAALVAAAFAVAPRADAYIYWANQGTVGDPGATIGRANLDGSGVDQSFVAGTSAPCGVAVNDTHIYWGTRPGLAGTETGSIGRANLSGTSVTNSLVANPIQNPCGVALSRTHVYWVQHTSLGGGGRAGLNGENPNSGFFGLHAEEYPSEVAVHSTDVFWSTFGLEAGTGSIGRAIPGSVPDPFFIPPGGVADNVGNAMGVAVNDTHIFWANATGGSIGRATIGGSEPDKNFIRGADEPCGVAVDATHVYWANRSSGTIGRADLNGTGVDQSFISGAKHPCGVAVDRLSSSPPPSNEFSFGKVARSKRRGTATLQVVVPAPGAVELSPTRQVKRAKKRAEAAGRVKLRVTPTRTALRKLEKRGRATVTATVVYTPDGGEARTRAKRLKLVKRS